MPGSRHDAAFGRAPAGVERAARRFSPLRMGSISMADLDGIAILTWCNQALTNAAVPKVRSNKVETALTRLSVSSIARA
jgi:hypothetical protein